MPLSAFPEHLLWPAKVMGWQPVGDHVTFYLYTPHITFPPKDRCAATKVQLSATYVMYAHRGGMTPAVLQGHPLAIKSDMWMICVPEAVILVESVLAAISGATTASITSVLRGGAPPPLALMSAAWAGVPPGRC